MKKLHCGILLLCAGMLASAALADTLELKNGSVIKGTYVGGNENQISFRVGANVQQYDVADVSALRFDSRESGRSREFAEPPRDSGGFASRSDRDSDNSRRSTNVSTMTVPTGTRLLVRTIEPIDSAKNRVGDKFPQRWKKRSTSTTCWSRRAAANCTAVSTKPKKPDTFPGSLSSSFRLPGS